MSYSVFDLSKNAGRPLELFRFVQGSLVWTHSSSRQEVHNAETYTPLAIDRSEINDSGEMSKQPLTLSIPRNSPVALLYAGGNGEPLVTLTVFRRHVGDSETVVYWRGRVVGVGFDGAACVLTCESVFTTLRRSRRGRYTRLCGRAHYLPGCNLNKADWAISGTVLTINGRVVRVSMSGSYPDNWFAAGMIDWGDGPRMIYSQDGEFMTLMSVPSGLTVGDPVTVYPGCDRKRETCRDKFNNLLNCSAFAWIPTDNPFRGSIV